MDWSNPGSSDFHIYKDGFHDRLSRYWPEPREQLHSGGWAKTREMVADIKRLMAGGKPGGITRVLDLCCGEGATASFLAAREGWEVTGVELVESAVLVARSRAERYGTFVRVQLDTSAEPQVATASLTAVQVAADVVSAVRVRLSYHPVADLVRIAHASIHYMPLPSNSYDVVYGQDPDGLANENRLFAFREVFRVLRPGGLFYFWHHWIPGPRWPSALLHEYWADPITGSPRLSHECYLEDLRASGLQLVCATDTTALAASHMGAMAERMRREAPAPDGSLPDQWLERALQFAARGGTMGIQVVAFKPPAPSES
ncbi:hypothetical protein PLESTB_000349400 [Pleodorina starrii]|uniref:Uncharacterized protein n=1 Tax=Pleodorina starrii TaxID=330485 RepID=A0A9W6BDJ0_9CHLO|nr:hypothetical protein PLESTM_000045600 [Pleodorina starrii]GLC50162.1 hypothetical protein PLESTB_000349400 [Pleodorina starrii]GLC73059.1 hypothetical protein PLESTF_001327200 [Pleodorina starrii]